MVLKIVYVLAMSLLTFLANGGLSEKPAQVVVADVIDASTEVMDTFVCPQLEETTQYLQQGLSVELQSCSLVSWTEVQESRSLGMFQASYQEWADVDDTAPTQVEVFEVKIDSLHLYAIKDPVIDDHDLDPDIVGDSVALKTGIQTGVAYEVWYDAPTG